MKKLRLPLLLVAFLVAVACSQQGSTVSSPVTPSDSLAVKPSDTAIVKFGLDSLGSSFDPASDHDQSGHARDSLVPGTVVINRGDTVTFKLPAGAVHQVAIYDRGTEPEDINTSALSFGGCFGVPLINDTTNRINTPAAQPCAGGPTTVNFKFDKPAGKYLVICTFLPHFNVGMYGWVVVRDR